MAEIKISRLESFPSENPNGWVVGFTVNVDQSNNFYEVTTVSYKEASASTEAVDVAYTKLKTSIEERIKTIGNEESLLGKVYQPKL